MQSIVLAALVAAAAAAPRPQNFQDFNNQQFIDNNQQQFVSSGQFIGGGGGDSSGVRVLQQTYEEDPNARTYNYAYELDNGVRAEQRGNVQPGPEPETGVLTQEGSYSFTGDDGNTYTVTYVANDGGFQPQGDHLPVAPAQIPEYAQLRQEYPQLFWAENGGAGLVQNSNQFVDNNQFIGGGNQFTGQSFSGQFIN